VVSLYEVIDDPMAEKQYIVMQYVDGGPLCRPVASRPHEYEPIAAAKLLQVAEDVLSAVAYLHRKGVVHRDIKIQNVLLDANSVAYLADFGVSEAFSDKHAGRVDGFKGTPLYMCPELHARRPNINGYAADMWAVGVTLFAALTGRLPFRSVAEIEAYDGALEVPEQYGAMWARLLRGLLHIDPSRRWAVKRTLNFINKERSISGEVGSPLVGVNGPSSFDEPALTLAVCIEDNNHRASRALSTFCGASAARYPTATPHSIGLAAMREPSMFTLISVEGPEGAAPAGLPAEAAFAHDVQITPDTPSFSLLATEGNGAPKRHSRSRSPPSATESTSDAKLASLSPHLSLRQVRPKLSLMNIGVTTDDGSPPGNTRLTSPCAYIPRVPESARCRSSSRPGLHGSSSDRNFHFTSTPSDSILPEDPFRFIAAPGGEAEQHLSAAFVLSHVAMRNSVRVNSAPEEHAPQKTNSRTALQVYVELPLRVPPTSPAEAAEDTTLALSTATGLVATGTPG
jgi:serine/threonine protein kinase